MRGLPKDVDLAILVGRTLEQVCIGQFQITAPGLMLVV
jgi:hypothetical protein